MMNSRLLLTVNILLGMFVPFVVRVHSTRIKADASSTRRKNGSDRRRRFLNVNDNIMAHSASPRIFGGWDTEEDRFPYAQVSLATHAEGHQCGGSLIAVDAVLTAAHCAGSYDKIVIGKHSLYDAADESETFGALKEIVNPHYDEETTRFDNMIIILDGWSSLADPVRLNTDNAVPENGQLLTVLGWGYDQNWDLPSLLQETEVTYTRNIDCVNFKDDEGLTLKTDLYGDMMCAGDEGRDSCYGRSHPNNFIGSIQD
jgi:secreted trypsin-like serine protease